MVAEEVAVHVFDHVKSDEKAIRDQTRYYLVMLNDEQANDWKAAQKYNNQEKYVIYSNFEVTVFPESL